MKGTIALDSRDLAILKVLSTHGRISKTSLAERVGLSPTPCWNRMQKLEKAGLIQSYAARIDLQKLGRHVTIFVAAELGDHTAASFRKFEAAMEKYEEITGCWALGGGFDYLLQIVTSDIESYQILIDDMLNANIGLARYFTYVVTKPVKSGGPPPLNMIAGI